MDILAFDGDWKDRPNAIVRLSHEELSRIVTGYRSGGSSVPAKPGTYEFAERFDKGIIAYLELDCIEAQVGLGKTYCESVLKAVAEAKQRLKAKREDAPPVP